MSMRFSNLKVRSKLIAGFGAILLLLVAISGYNILSTNRIKDEAAFVRDNASKRAMLSMHIKLAVVQVQQWLTDSSATGWSDGFDEAESWAGKFREGSAQLKELLSDPDDLRGLEAIEGSFEDYYSMGVKMARAYVDEGRESGNRMMKEFDAYAEDINQKVDKFGEEGHHQLEMALKAVNDRADSAGKTGIWITILAILISVTLSLLLASRIVRPINRIVDVAQDMAEGDLTRTVEVRSKDEIGALGEAFNKMVANLSNIVDQVRGASNYVASASNQLSKSANTMSVGAQQQASSVNETASTIDEMASSIRQVAESSESMASAAQQTSSAIDEMITSIQQVASNAGDAEKIAQQASQEVSTGQEVVRKSLAGLERISESVNESAKTIRELGERSQGIGEILTVIADIAGQTNLLALNAAIEAARAGEAGKGFAVVAEEIRKLAERSAEQTKEIAELVKAIREGASSAVQSMQETSQVVEEGMGLGRQVDEALGRITEAVSQTTLLAQQIAQATEEQSSGSRQVADATQKMTQMTQEISAAMEEQSKSSDQVVNAMESMNEVTQQSAKGAEESASAGEELSKQAEGLLELVGRFKTNSRGTSEFGLQDKGILLAEEEG